MKMQLLFLKKKMQFSYKLHTQKMWHSNKVLIFFFFDENHLMYENVFHRVWFGQNTKMRKNISN